MVWSYGIDHQDLSLFTEMLRSRLDHDKIVSWFRSVLKYLPTKVDCNMLINEAIKARNRDVVGLLLRKSITTESIKRQESFDFITDLQYGHEFDASAIALAHEVYHCFDDVDEGIYDLCRLIRDDIDLHLIKVDRLMNQGKEDSGLNSELNEQELECQKELDTMKEGRSGTKMSLYHVLTTCDPKYTLNETLLHDLESVNLEEFPLYGSMIEDKLIGDKEKAKLLKKCTRYLGHLIQTAERVMLPRELLEKILSCLEYYDLYMLECWGEGVEAKYTKSTNVIDLMCYKRKVPRFLIQQVPFNSDY